MRTWIRAHWSWISQRIRDTKEVPPCIILKSDGAALYTTTDLATIIERRKLFDPDEIIYVVDKRQEMHFIQVFRCARKTGLVKDRDRPEIPWFWYDERKRRKAV